MLRERSQARDHTDMKRPEESDTQREKADERLSGAGVGIGRESDRGVMGMSSTQIAVTAVRFRHFPKTHQVCA